MKRLLLFIVLIFVPLLTINCSSITQNSAEIAFGSWIHYKRTFIVHGRVCRPRDNNDTVSEGQAYGMLRAVLMNDHATFDECLDWTEGALSRKSSDGDRLLAWHYQNGVVADRKSASDADIDYAYSLILASRKWNDVRYRTLAEQVLQSVLEKETAIINGRLYFLPWPREYNQPDQLTALNPSYYAPSHFKLFFEVSGDHRWLELVDTTYYMLGKLLDFPGVLKKGTLVPDWIAVDAEGNITELPGNDAVYGWDAVRVPLRIAADYYLSGDKRALTVLRQFSASFEKELSNPSKDQAYQNALFYSAAYAATEAAGSSLSPSLLQQIRHSMRKNDDGFFYNEHNDYYINSLSWLPEYYHIIKATGKQMPTPLSSDGGR
ncbi:MAG: glycosyl hydrolase family 8 [Chlorobium sp.]